MPWRVMAYKAFNTFVDDAFALMVSMPTAHRVACLRRRRRLPHLPVPAPPLPVDLTRARVRHRVRTDARAARRWQRRSDHRPAGGRAEPRAVPADARPRHRAAAPTCSGFRDAARMALLARPFSSEVVTLAGHQAEQSAWRRRPRRPHHHRLGRRHRQGVARRRVRAHHPGAHTQLGLGAWRCCRAARASSAARKTAPRSCGRSTALSSAPSRWEASCVMCIAALPDGVHFVVGLRHQQARSGCTTSTGRSSTPSPRRTMPMVGTQA